MSHGSTHKELVLDGVFVDIGLQEEKPKKGEKDESVLIVSNNMHYGGKHSKQS